MNFYNGNDYNKKDKVKIYILFYCLIKIRVLLPIDIWY